MGTAINDGFTVIEFMTTLLIAAIVFGIGQPAYTEFIANNRIIAATAEMTTAIHMARAEAIQRRANVTLCPSSNWNAEIPACDGDGSFSGGWIAFADCALAPPPINTCGGPNYVVDIFDTVLARHGPLDDHVAENFATNAGAPAYIAFSATGFPRTIAALGVPPKSDFQICDQRGNYDVGDGIAAGRWLQISATGRPQIYRTIAELQDATQNPLGGC